MDHGGTGKKGIELSSVFKVSTSPHYCSDPTLTKINQNKQQKMEEDTVTAPAVSLNCPKECLVNLVENTPFIQILCTLDNKF